MSPELLFDSHSRAGGGMSDITVIHLVRKANGPEPFERFMAAYNAHAAGVKHDLLLAKKGFEEKLKWPAGEMLLPDTGFDIGTYRRAAEDVTTEYVCFLNSFSRPLVRGWLHRLMSVVLQPGVGLVGCTGSLEISPHIRTNAFCMRRDLFLACVERSDLEREECLALETGPRSITRQVEARGLKARVVSAVADGSIGDRHTRIFRWREQEGLLVADNRTDHYQDADRVTREWLQRLAWGETE